LKSMTKEMGLTSVHVTHDQDEALEMADRMAIIRRGKIVQVGTPKEIFQNPTTPFVANFVGRSNILSGVIGKTGDAFTEVILSNGSSVYTRKTDIPVGTDVVIAIKIGSTRIEHVPEPPAEEEYLPKGYFEATIDRILYEGATITVEMSAEGLKLITAKLPNRKYDLFSEGDKVIVDWLPEKATVFRMPECGLEEELRLD
jgi:spermidine/putrescine transport system ATP-binding protein